MLICTDLGASGPWMIAKLRETEIVLRGFIVLRVFKIKQLGN